MLETIAVALLPAVITVVLGFVAAKRHDFVVADASVLIKMATTRHSSERCGRSTASRFRQDTAV